MDIPELNYFVSQALMVMLVLSLPTVAACAAVGVLVGLVQGLTQIQDQTISFALRLITCVVTLAATSRWFGIELHSFTLEVFDKIA